MWLRPHKGERVPTRDGGKSPCVIVSPSIPQRLCKGLIFINCQLSIINYGTDFKKICPDYLSFQRKSVFLQLETFKSVVMSTVALNGLLDYLFSTLSTTNMRWVGEHLLERAKKQESEQLRTFTMKEIDSMLDEAEAAFEAGDYLTQEEVFRH